MFVSNTLNWDVPEHFILLLTFHERVDVKHMWLCLFSLTQSRSHTCHRWAASAGFLKVEQLWLWGPSRSESQWAECLTKAERNHSAKQAWMAGGHTLKETTWEIWSRNTWGMYNNLLSPNCRFVLVSNRISSLNSSRTRFSVQWRENTEKRFCIDRLCCFNGTALE